MKKFLLLCVFLITSLLTYAQQFSQEGAYLDNKPHGVWVEYNPDGEVKTIAHYDKGVKVGTWVYISNDQIKEVLYDNNKLIQVTSYTKESVAYVH